MWRAILEPLAFFITPFALYLAFLLTRGRHPLKPVHWPNSAVASLTIAGLVLAILGMLWFGVAAKRQSGAYVPAHVENGKVVPGHFE
ncbi:MAG: DUF6111 family protein [Rhodoblastus sp.]